MSRQPTTLCTAFAGTTRIASGRLAEVARAVKARGDEDPDVSLSIFDDATSEPIELDLRGSLEAVLKRVPETVCVEMPESPEPAGPGTSPAPRTPGRPRLGVVAREVTLLPRHWEWLGGQPGGASVALRKLVEQARRANEAKDRVRLAQEATYRFMSAMGGNLPGFEEAIRALYAGARERFEERLAAWPPDLRDHARRLADQAFAGEAATVGEA